MSTKKITPTMLAKDVLKYLDSKTRGKIRLYPMNGRGYLRVLKTAPKGYELVPDIPTTQERLQNPHNDLQKILQKGKPCQVCALGAMLAAKAIRMDQVQLTGAHATRNTCEYELSDIFNRSDLDRIEQAFERGAGLPLKEAILDAKGRLKAICKNIIRNKGKFVPLWLNV